MLGGVLGGILGRASGILSNGVSIRPSRSISYTQGRPDIACLVIRLSA